MPFTPSVSAQTTTWTTDNASSNQTWTNETIPDIFDVLCDIDGNLIVDTDSNDISLLGGFITDVASTVASVNSNNSNQAVTWTAEG